jgi:LacI family transcriptional regulator
LLNRLRKKGENARWIAKLLKIMAERRPRLAIFLHVMGPYYDQLRHGIAAYHQLHGPWEFVHESVHPDADDLRHVSDVDGVIVALSGNRNPETVRRLREFIGQSDKPIVEVSPDGCDLPIPQVRADDVAVGRMAAEYLLTLRFNTFGFLGIPLPFSEQRLRGFSEVLTSNGMECLTPPSVEEPWWDSRRQSEVHRAWFRSVPKPIAVLAAFESMAALAITYAQDEGILVPDQMALMGVDNGALCELYRPSITSIPLDGVRAGFEAAQLLHHLIEGGAAPAGPILIPPLATISRGSTDSLAIEDRDVIAAVRYIRDHAAKAISVSEIVRHVAVSRRKLEKRFQAVLNRSIGDEIHRVQARRAAELLRGTRLTVEEIAQKSGYGSSTALARVFKRIIGSSPSEYRRRCFARASPLSQV